MDGHLPTPLTIDRLLLIMPRAPARAAAGWVEGLTSAMAETGIDTPARAAAFLAQIAHESGELRRTVENLNYSAAGLLATWPGRFDQATADLYARRPEAIANRVYANRLGNGDEASGDGWRYRGRGLIQVTGRSNYSELGLALHVELERYPELLEGRELACRSAALWWASHGCNVLADQGDLVALTRRINGGLHGLAERRRCWERARRAFGLA